MVAPRDIEEALSSVVGKITDRNYEQSLACFRFWLKIGQTYCQIPYDPGPDYSKTLFEYVFDAIWRNRTATPIDPGCGKLVHPTAHLILRLARDVESDHLLAHHGDGLQTRLRTKVLLEFFKTNLELVQGKNDHPAPVQRWGGHPTPAQGKSGLPNRLQSFCADTSLIAHCINLGHVEEDVIHNHILQSLITHPNLYDHQADGLIILFKLAGTTLERYADPSVVDRCFNLLKD